MPDCIQVTTTTETREDAERIAGELVGERLAACVQIMGPIASTYWWEGRMENSVEWLCTIKTSAELYNEVEALIKRTHCYQMPEIVAVPITSGSEEYLSWLMDGLKEPDR
jgi:periplasmic divalent cation tolerance protein